MRKHWKLVVASGITIAGVVAGFAIPSIAATTAPKQFFAVLNGGQQSPSVASAGLGVAHLTYDAETRELCVDMTVSDLSSAITAAHVHRGAIDTSPANNVVFGLNTTNPFNDLCGTLSKADAELLLKRRLYVNVHTTNNPSGEVRGQILK